MLPLHQLLALCCLFILPAAAAPVLQGYDVVEYFGKGSQPRLGISSLACRLLTHDLSSGEKVPFGFYEFWFSSEENVALFEEDPWKYAPKYGGFDSLGIADEVGASWPWSKEFLGPPVHPWAGFSTHKDRLYMHVWNPQEFLDDAQLNVARADHRWIEWYGSLNAGPFNTHCQSDICRSLPQARQDLAGMNTSVPEVQCSTNGFMHPLSELVALTGATQREVFQLQRQKDDAKRPSFIGGSEDGGSVEDEGEGSSKQEESGFVGSFLGSSASTLHVERNMSEVTTEMSEIYFDPELVGKPAPLLNDPITNDFVQPALLGFDTVAYFHIRGPAEGVLGNPRYACHLATYDKSGEEPSLVGVYEFWFKNQENMEQFEEDPWKYVPQYGGFCSWGVATELKIQGWPWDKEFLGPPAQPWDGWTIFDGKLYLNYWPSISGSFFSHPEMNIRRGNKRWIEWWGALDAGPINTHCPNAICLDVPQNLTPRCPPDAICKGKIPEVSCHVRDTS